MIILRRRREKSCHLLIRLSYYLIFFWIWLLWWLCEASAKLTSFYSSWFGIKIEILVQTTVFQYLKWIKKFSSSEKIGKRNPTSFFCLKNKEARVNFEYWMWVFKQNCRDFFFYKKQHKMHIFKLFIKKSKTGDIQVRQLFIQ